MRAIYPADLLAETLRIAARCTFDLDELNYDYPQELVPEEFDADANAYLRQLTYDGAARTLAAGNSGKVREQIEKELALIAELRSTNIFS